MTRSLLIFSNFSDTQEVSNFRFLKVLDVLTKSIKLDPKKVVHLRYLAVIDTCDKEILEALSHSSNLQTLCIMGRKSLETYSAFQLPLKVWKMSSLRHLITKSPFHLEQPSDHNEIVEESNLQTLSVVANLELSSVTIDMLANVRKLGLYYYRTNRAGLKTDYQLSNLIHLGKIQELEIMFENVERSDILELKFPSSLKKLTFGCRTRNLSDDKNVAALDFLPNVRVLKLKGQICTRGREWKPVEDQFDDLRYLELDTVNLKHWEVESFHFPSLEILVLKNMRDELEEIPIEIGEIDSLQRIQLHFCRQSLVDSAQQIRESQIEMGNNDLRVVIAEEDISLGARNSEALARWRQAVALVKNRRRRFRYSADLGKRSEAVERRKALKEKIHVSLLTVVAALRFLEGAQSKDNSVPMEVQSSDDRVPILEVQSSDNSVPMEVQDGGYSLPSILSFMCRCFLSG